LFKRKFKDPKNDAVINIKKEITQFMEEQIEPVFLKGYAREDMVNNKYDKAIWFHYKARGESLRSFSFNILDFQVKTIVLAKIHFNEDIIRIEGEEKDLISFFNTIPKELKKYSLSQLYTS
jgi:hypothetical protein